MVENSVLIPQRNAAGEVRDLLPGLCGVMQRLGAPYEIVVIDDGSTRANQQALAVLLRHFPPLRLLQIAQPAGTSVALSAGIAAARGARLLALEAGRRYAVEQIPELLRGLVQADLVVGRRIRGGWAKAWHRLLRIPRWLLLGLEVRDPGCLFWAARREALEGMELSRGMYRYLSTLVAARGWRAMEIGVTGCGGRATTFDSWPNPGDLLFAWWLKRRLRVVTVQEITAQGGVAPALPAGRLDAAHAGPNPRATRSVLLRDVPSSP